MTTTDRVLSVPLRIASLAAVLILAAAGTQAQEVLVVTADRIFTVSGGVIEKGAVLVENGKIKAVGPAVAVPAAARAIKARVVIPGLIDGHTHLGVYSLPRVTENEDGNEMTDPVTPQVRALDSFNFDDPAIKVGLAGGVTTIVSRPGSGNVIGGSSVAVKLKQAPPARMVLREICDLKMAVEGNPIGVYGAKNQAPATLMSVYALARKAFVEAQEYMASLEAHKKALSEGKDQTPPKRDLGKETLAMALRREIPVHIHVATAAEVATSIRLADEFKLRLSLGHAYWAHLILDEIRDRKDVHFNIGPPMFFDYFDDILTFKNAPAILANAGLRVSLQTDALGGGQQNLLHLAALCVRYGMKEADALKAVTLAGAEAVGLEDRIGSISPGKDADLVLLNGDPFETTTSVEAVVIDGKVEYEATAAPTAALTAVKAATRALQLPPGLDKAAAYAVRGGTVMTMAGPALRNATVLVENGKVKAVGAAVAVPKGAPVIDATDFVIMPGLVAARSHLGLASNWRRQSSIDEVSKAATPELEVKHAIEPQLPHFSYVRQLGITTALVTPGNRNVIGGRGTVVKTVGLVVDKMIVKDAAVMMAGLGTPAKRKDQMPSTRMGIAAVLRDTLIKAREYQEKLAARDKEKDKGKESEFKRDLAMEALLPVLQGGMPVMIHCERRDDILTALRVADEFKLKVVLDGATDAWKVTSEIKARGVPVVLENLYRGAGNVEDAGFDPRTPALLSAAGIPIAFKARDEGSWYTPGAGESGGDLLEIAAFALKHGLSEEAALRAVTIDAAAILGVEKRVGSLEPGKDADLVILRGHPLQIASVPEAVIIDGRLVYQRRDGAQLK